MEKIKNIKWLENFKIAIIKSDFSLIEKLSLTIPKFIEYENMIKTQYLIKESIVLLYQEKQATAKKMQQIKINKSFLLSSDSNERGLFFNHSY